MNIPFERSIASHPKSKFWSTKNKLKPEQVCKSSDKKLWFNCDNCCHEFIKQIKGISKGEWCPYCCIPSKKLCENDDCKECFDKSLASNPKSKFWSNKNELSIYQVFKYSNLKFWFDCKVCNHDFEATVANVTNDSWCPYCANQKLCENDDCKNCFEKSFASHPKSKYWSEFNELHPKNVFISSGKKYEFLCDCGHTFISKLDNIMKNRWCPYCSKPPKQLCEDNNCKKCFEKSFASHPKSEFWNVKNKSKPRDLFKYTNQKFIFNCNKCSNEFKTAISNITNLNSWCPKCRYKTELKLFNWLKTYNINVESQVKFYWCKKIQKLPFDFLLEKYKLIIELDGLQHFKQVSNWQSPEKTQENDEFKNKSALDNGYHMIRISQEIVLADKEDWENKLKEAINTCIKSNETLYLTIGEVYNNF
jgi:very-short-patch-repair endonuclease